MKRKIIFCTILSVVSFCFVAIICKYLLERPDYIIAGISSIIPIFLGALIGINVLEMWNEDTKTSYEEIWEDCLPSLCSNFGIIVNGGCGIVCAIITVFIVGIILNLSGILIYILIPIISEICGFIVGWILGAIIFLD